MKLDNAEFERLAIEQLDLLYRIARRMTRDAGAAEDLVQETYVRALRARDTFDLQERGIRPWLVRILHNLHLNQLKRQRPQAMEDAHLESAVTPPSITPLPLDPRDFEAMDERLVRAIEMLPGEYSTVLLLWSVEDFSYKEISESLEIPLGTVMSRLHRARQRLAEQLRELAIEQRIIRE